MGADQVALGTAPIRQDVRDGQESLALPNVLKKNRRRAISEKYVY